MIANHVLRGTALLLLLSVGQAQQQKQTQEPKPTEAAPKEKPLKEHPRRRVITDLSGFDLLASKNKHVTRPTVAAATRGLQSAVALAPKLARLYAAYPVFVWSYPVASSRFQFSLLNSEEKEVFRSDITGTSYQYPETAPSLEPGRTYFWSVETFSELLTSSPSDPVGFIVLSTEEMQAVKKALAKIQEQDPFRLGIARAQVFTDQRLWYDAIGVYTELIAQYPDRPELYDERGMLYAQLAVTRDLSEKDFIDADKLRGQGRLD